MITLINLGAQNASSIFVPNGSISLALNVDATVVATPYGFVCADIPIVFQLDANGNILPNAPAAAATIWSNAELNPQNAVGLGTYYLVTIYDANGARLNAVPMWWQFTQAANATVNISQMVPFQTEGNVIFYPTSFTIPTPTISTLGGVFSSAAVTSQWLTSINTDGTVSRSQPAFSDISGTIAAGQLPTTMTLTSFTVTGLITGQGNIQLGVAGTTSGQITLEGSTSGSCTITAPAVAGISTNPISFSNSVNIPSGAVYTINTDTGLSRDSAGVIDVGNGTAGDTSGTVKATTFIGQLSGTIVATSIGAAITLSTATQPTVRLTDSEVTVTSAVTSISGSVVGVRGAVTLSPGGTITGSSFIYGVQGKLIAQGTLNNGSAFNAGLFAQLDTSNAGFAHTSGYFAPIIADFGATSHLSSDPLADGIIVLNTTTSLINSILKTEAKANYLFDLNDLSQGNYIVTGAVGGSQDKKLQVLINGVVHYIALNTA